jgi:hypothetical protein
MNPRVRLTVVPLTALCALAAGCERSEPTTGPTPAGSQHLSLATNDSVTDVPTLQLSLPRRARLFDTDAAALEASIHSTVGLAFVAFKSPSAARTFEAGGHRAAMSAAMVRRALSAVERPGVQVLKFYPLTGMVYARLGSGVATELRHDSLVDWVEPALKPKLEPTLGSPVAPHGKAPTVHGAASVVTMPWNISLVNAPPAWSLTTGVSAKILILSGGIGNDPDLPAIPSGNCGGFFNACGDSPLWWDGTAIAGITWAMNGSYSIVGVAPGIRGSNIYSWSDWNNYTTLDLNMELTGISNGVDRGVRTMLIDFIHTDAIVSEQAAIEAAISAGVTVVAGAGSLGQYYSAIYPASYPNVIGVSGVRPDGVFAGAGTCPYWTTGSDYGPYVKLAAPIAGVTTFGGGRYYDFWWLGYCHTKLAAAHVAGAAALLNDLHPNWTPAQIAQALMLTASGGGTRINDQYGYGLLNVAAAVGYTPFSVTMSGPSRVKPNQQCGWFANTTGGVPPYSYTWIPSGHQDGNEVMESFSGSGQVTLTVWAYDARGWQATTSRTITVTSSAPTCAY